MKASRRRDKPLTATPAPTDADPRLTDPREILWAIAQDRTAPTYARVAAAKALMLDENANKAPKAPELSKIAERAIEILATAKPVRARVH